MADNMQVTAGTGTLIALDEIVDGTLGTVKVQYVKLMDGTLDGTSKATVNANGLKVDGVSGSFPIVDGGGSITIDGSVAVSSAPVTHVIIDSGNPTSITANAGTNLNTSLLATETTLGTVHGHVDSIDTKTPALGQAAMAASVPVVLASNQTSIPVAATLAAETTKVIGTVNVAGSQTIAVTNAGTFAVQTVDTLRDKTLKSIKVAYTATTATILTPTSGYRAIITKIQISASATGAIYLFDNTDDSTHGIGCVFTFAANGGMLESSGFYPSAANNNLIKYTASGSAAGSIWIQYYEVNA